MKRFIQALLVICMVILSGCSSPENGTNNKTDQVSSIDMKEDGGNLVYKGYEFAHRDIYFNHDSDGNAADKTVFVIFTYTNNIDAEKRLKDDYDIKVYQNGKELSTVLNYNPSYAPEAFMNTNHIKIVLKDGSMDVAAGVIIESEADLTVVANYKGESGASQSMTIKLENIPDYSQTLDLKRKDLFGTWVGLEDGRILELTDTNLKVKASATNSTGRTWGSWDLQDNHIVISTVIMMDVIEVNGEIHLVAVKKQFDQYTDEYVKR